jgi:hypothetical protein
MLTIPSIPVVAVSTPLPSCICVTDEIIPSSGK